MPHDQNSSLAVPAPDAPLRIIQVVNVRWFNATAWYALFLSRLLREAGHSVRVLGLADTESFAKAREWGLEPEALPLTSKNPLDYPALYLRLRRLARDFRPHIVNCHRGEAFALWTLLRRTEPGIRLIRTRGDQRPPKANRVNALMHARLADAVICTSSGIAESMQKSLGVPREKLHIILGGVDTRLWRPDPAGRQFFRAAWGLLPQHLALGLVGRFDAVKGQRELIAAFARLLEKSDAATRGKLRLVLAGFSTSAMPREQIEAWAGEAGIANHLILPGKCPDARGLMAALDLGIVASLGSETIARVALEMMACGLPLVGTRVGVMPDLLSDGALVPPGDVAALAALLGRFCGDASLGPALRAEQAGRMSTLTERDFYERTMAVYHSVLGQTIPPL